jgi:site-specific recombinase XerC
LGNLERCTAPDCRISELVGLDVDDVDLDGGAGDGQGNKGHIVPRGSYAIAAARPT